MKRIIAFTVLSLMVTSCNFKANEADEVSNEPVVIGSVTMEGIALHRGTDCVDNLCRRNRYCWGLCNPIGYHGGGNDEPVGL